MINVINYDPQKLDKYLVEKKKQFKRELAIKAAIVSTGIIGFLIGCTISCELALASLVCITLSFAIPMYARESSPAVRYHKAVRGKTVLSMRYNSKRNQITIVSRGKNKVLFLNTVAFDKVVFKSDVDDIILDVDSETISAPLHMFANFNATTRKEIKQ